MAKISPYPQFTYLFAAIRRADLNSRPVMLRTTATSEQSARRQWVADYMLVFAGRLPAVEVRHA